MSNIVNGRTRTKTAREAYIEYNQNKKRKPFTHLKSYDDTNIAYHSTPEYLRQLMNTSTLSNASSTRSLTRTYSATEMTPRNLGNPKYKAQEDYYDEVQALKKELKTFKDDNSHLRAKIRRLEEDNARKRKEFDNLCTTTNSDSRRSSITSSPTLSSSTNNIVMNLKQRLFKLELQLKQKETTIDEMKTDPRWTKGTELEIQNRALFNEIEKQKFERLNFIQNDYPATIEEEKKNAIKKLETQNRDLKIENKNLKKKVREFEKPDEQASARERDESPDDDDHHHHHHKHEDTKELRNKYENEIDQIKSNLKQIRRERDKYRDKYENLNEDFEEIKRERDQYRQKFQQIKYESEQQQTKSNLINRSSPTLKRDDEHYHKRSLSNLSHRDSHSPEEISKKDSRPNTPIKKSNEHLTSRSSKKSLQNFRHDDSIKDEDYYRKKRRREEEQAATIIQRNWRKHNKLRKKFLNNKTKQNSFDQRHSRTGGIASPRTSQQKLGSKIENLDSGSFKSRPTSSDASHNTALKTIQAALRGYIHRTDLDKGQKSERNENDDDRLGTLSRQYGSERRRENFQNQSNNRLQTSNRDLTSKFRRTPSPPIDQYRPSSPHIANNYGSKQNLFHDRTQLGSGNRLAMNDREPLPRTHRTPSPPADIQRSSSPRNLGSKQSLPNDKNKFVSNNRLERESSLKLQRPYSPSNPRHISPENIRPLSRQSNTSVRKSPNNSKQILNNIHDDDEDVSGF